MIPETTSPVTELLIKRKTPLRRRLWFRVVCVLATCAVVLFGMWYWPRRTMIAVWRANGMVFCNRAGESLSQSEAWAEYLGIDGWLWDHYEEASLLFSSMGTDAEVYHVHLVDANIDDGWLKRLRGFRKLSSVGLHARQLGPGLAALQDQFVFLNVAYASGDRLAELQHLPQMETLILTSADPRDIDLMPLAALPKLRALHFNEYRGLTVLLERLPELSNLEYLSLQNCQSLSDADVAHLAKLPRLKSFNMHRSGTLGDAAMACLAELPELENLYLFHATGTITDEGVNSLLKFNGRLKELTIVPNTFTDEQKQRLRDGLPWTTVWVQ